MNFFGYNNETHQIQIDDAMVLSIKEFKDLWDPSRNKCKEDPTGIQRLRAFRELVYIYLMYDYKSPYFEYLEKDKQEAATLDAELTEKELADEVFKTACDKYIEMQNANRVLSLIRTAHKKLWQTQVFLDSIDFTEVDDMGKPIYKPKDVFADISSIAKIKNDLATLEMEYKKGLSSKSKLRADNTPGYKDI